MEITRENVSGFGSDCIRLFLYRAYFERDREDEILFKVLDIKNKIVSSIASRKPQDFKPNKKFPLALKRENFK